jgi:NAD-dependent DNA ligase
LADFVIAFTGEFLDFDKMAVIEVCMQLGAECPKSLTKKCNLLIQGDCVLDQFKRKKAQLVSETDKSISAVERGI